MEPRELTKGLGGFRSGLIRICVAIAVLWAALFSQHQRVIAFLARPLDRPMAYFKVPEAFYASLKVSLFAALFLLMPLIFYQLWQFVSPVFMKGAKRLSGVVTFFASLLFYSGAAVCYLVVLPAGVKFLLGFGGGQIEPVISVDRYITFATAFIFAFGLSFEMPLVLTLLSRVGAVSYRGLSKNRRYAILIIVIAAAIITPTPDVYNLSLMAGPLLVLYEISLILVRIFGKK